MAFVFKTRDANNNLVIDQDMLLSRYLTRVTVPWDDTSWHDIYHDGFLMGTPFFSVYHPNVHSLTVYSTVYGNPSYIEVVFSGTKASYRQVWISGMTANNYLGKKDIVIHFGVF